MTTQSEMFCNLFDTTYGVLKRQVDGLTHEDSLLQLPFRGNCLNWILGHLITSRNDILELLGEPRFWDEATSAFYDRGSPGVIPENSDQA
ncbi:MAG TPA: hypothetical protein VHL11_14835, partial [Phototrophicaceae bacterium]|nr:hypothetical protein [Phototrophicaceae bacterium]